MTDVRVIQGPFEKLDFPTNLRDHPGLRRHRLTKQKTVGILSLCGKPTAVARTNVNILQQQAAVDLGYPR